MYLAFNSRDHNMFSDVFFLKISENTVCSENNIVWFVIFSAVLFRKRRNKWRQNRMYFKL
ncbi:hypothetical protein UA45_07845 [Morganella morganii]|uniref:Uncharacterized protein n=1 Tax=Morganella morganii TaxID=582 RepID=A0A0D8LAR2_MORMO|nr:hypothetical protein UA45_07845 [Morganella morganii]